MWWRTILAVWGILPVGGTLYFFVFWTWFDFWRKHRAFTYALLAATFGVIASLVASFRDVTLAGRLDLPLWVQIIGWIVLAIVTVFGTIADRQIGVRIRSFTPFFEEHARIELRTRGAYGVVRHPIYAAGIWFQLGIFLVTGYPAVLVSCAIFTPSAFWFTREEEDRLKTLLEDPSEYDRYRERVPALFPHITRRSSA